MGGYGTPTSGMYNTTSSVNRGYKPYGALGQTYDTTSTWDLSYLNKSVSIDTSDKKRVMIFTI